MRNADTVLGIIRERGNKGLPLEDVYRQLYNPGLYLLAYAKIQGNQGAMTPGTTKETVDGMSLEKIQGIIELIRYERFQFQPVRRVYIEKKNSTKKRPLGMPTWTDKLVQEVMRLILEAYYEPQFSNHSHGFRPDRGCHTALTTVERTWRGTAWFIEGDIKGCFDNIDHTILMSILREKIQDNRFLRLIENCLQAGYLEDWRFNETLSGTPQGGIISPILANIYLDRLDKFVEETLLTEHNRGKRRAQNVEYKRYAYHIKEAERKGEWEEAKTLDQERRKLPSIDPNDPDFRRLGYVRYADDFLLGYAGPKETAEDIKRVIGEYLHDHLKLTLSEEKTLVTHAQSETARFLGYDILVKQEDRYRATNDGRRTLNGVIGLSVPEEVVRERCKRYTSKGKPIHRMGKMHDSDFAIVTQFQAEYRGFAEYYQLAYNRSGRLKRLRWIMEQSLVKTLAAKYNTSVGQIYERYQTDQKTTKGICRVLQVVIEREGKKPLVATWGGISLARGPRDKVVLKDTDGMPLLHWRGKSDLLQRLLADECEHCGSLEDVEVHHIRRLSNLKTKGKAPIPWWVTLMAMRRRKTLVLCRNCHLNIHNGDFTGRRK